MKSDSSIKNITLAAIRRHAIDLNDWKYTQIDPQSLPEQIILQDEEIAIVYSQFTKDDWTVFTSRRIVGKSETKLDEILFRDIDDFIFGDFKNLNLTKTFFRITDIYGERADFFMETGKASMASIYALKTILELHRTSA